MITSLNIKNVGIIDEISIDLNKGLNVLTGETGAGKTLIIDSLSIISGGRFSKEMIRSGANYAYVEACIYLPDNDLAEDGNIIVSREVNITGKNLCKINGRMTTVSQLKIFMQNIIDIHGQHDNQAIMNQSKHIEFLDSYIGDNLTKLKLEYKELYNLYNKLLKELEINFGNDIEKRRMLDLLEYQYKEIDDAELKIGEEEDIQNRLKIIKSSEKITNSLIGTCGEIEKGVIPSLENVIKILGKIENLDNRYLQNLSIIKESYYELMDVSSNLSEYVNEVEYNEEELNQLQARQELIFSLKRKYGNSIEDILKYKDDVENQIHNIGCQEENNKLIKNKIRDLEEKMSIISNNMHEYRVNQSLILQNNIDKQLKDLEMKNAKFKVCIEKTDKYNNNGMDKVEFMISTNVGDTFKSFTKIASGGEISRIMLAIKTILASVDGIPVMIFDEIDTGISGIAAKSVGEKIKKISKSSQVLCVTHLAVIAAKADYNYYINKKVDKEKTKTCVRLLEEIEVIKEIARIATGEITKIALEHARELRKNKDIILA